MRTIVRFSRSYRRLFAGGVLCLLSSWQPITLVDADPFDPTTCDALVVAGGGPGGLYAAWRLIETGVADASRSCIFEQSHRVGGRMRSVREKEMPEELSSIGSKALDVGAYRAWPTLHPFVAAAWKQLGIETGCYHDIAFRTGDCTSECDPARAIHKFLRDKYVPFQDTLDSANVPYNLGPSNSWDVNSTYLSPYDWLYGAYAPPFWAENFEAMALSEDAADRFAARDRVVEASRTYEYDGTPGTSMTLKELATTGYNSAGVKMTKEDYDFFQDNDCSTGEHALTVLSMHDTVVEYANYFANGLALGLGGSFEVPVDAEGKQRGYDIVAPLMLEKLEAMGVSMYFGYQVARTRPKSWKPSWAHVKVIDLATDEEYRFDTEHVVLNVPSEAIRSILTDNTIQKYGRDDLFDVLQSIETLGLFKAYPFYEDAWWAKAGYTSGRMKSTLDMYHSRYHDGYAQCAADGDLSDCAGTLLGGYIQGEKGNNWAQQYFPARSFIESSDGLYIVRRGEGPPMQDRFLDELHAQNMESHRELLAENGIDADSIPAPDLCLVGDWLGPTAGAHLRVPTQLPAGTLDEAAVEPFPGWNIHFVNEAYGIPPGWLESSFYTAERMLHHYYGQNKADWFNDDVFDGFDSQTYYNSVIGNSNGNGK